MKQDYTEGSENIFKDLGSANPEEKLAKAELIFIINKIISEKGLTQKELATKIGITQGALSAFERGDKNPSKEVLNAMGELLEVPQTFFHYPADIISPSIIYYRKRSSMSKKTNAKIVALINIKRIQINELTKGVEIENSIDYIEPDSKKTPEHIARYTRQILNVPVGPITDIVNLIERAGIIICYIDIDDKKFDAVSFITENGQPVIFINSSFPNDRKTYSLAHELGHITQHLSFKIDLDRDYEKEADNFASEFLMPELDIKHHLHGLTLGRLATLKKHWKVSMASLLMRAKKLKLLTENQSKYLWMQMAKAGYRKKNHKS